VADVGAEGAQVLVVELTDLLAFRCVELVDGLVVVGQFVQVAEKQVVGLEGRVDLELFLLEGDLEGRLVVVVAEE
jgi:hypothetical protein